MSCKKRRMSVAHRLLCLIPISLKAKPDETEESASKRSLMKPMSEAHRLHLRTADLDERSSSAASMYVQMTPLIERSLIKRRFENWEE